MVSYSMKLFLNKNMKLFFIIVSIIILIGVVLFVRVIPSFGLKINENNNGVKYLTISNEIFYRQTLNNCGPYAVMGVINILQEKIQDPEILAKETRWRIIKNLTFPQGVVDLLHKYDIKTKEYSLKLYSNEDKKIWLKNQVDNGSPIILLVKVKNIQHYFTVLGYDEDGFMLYDSLQENDINNTRKTIVDKEEYAGNRYYTNNELMELWNKGGYKIFFRNWAVVCY
ncbi:hypothetical protein FACS1894110_22140 [Spirochaetia bacterium]|nr:hypothetical protein FACS1894110_22140 [Spirochaetia bacterium]